MANTRDLKLAKENERYSHHFDLSGAEFSGAEFWYANLSGANLSGALLSGEFRFANLSDTDLRGVDLSRSTRPNGEEVGGDFYSANRNGA